MRPQKDGRPARKAAANESQGGTAPIATGGGRMLQRRARGFESGPCGCIGLLACWPA